MSFNLNPKSEWLVKNQPSEAQPASSWGSQCVTMNSTRAKSPAFELYLFLFTSQFLLLWTVSQFFSPRSSSYVSKSGNLWVHTEKGQRQILRHINRTFIVLSVCFPILSSSHPNSSCVSDSNRLFATSPFIFTG